MLRRDFFKAGGVGVGTALFQRAVVTSVADDEPTSDKARPKTVTPEMVEQAEWVAGVTLTDAERKAVAGWLTRNLASREKGHAVELPNAIPPAIHFDPTTGVAVPPSDETNAVELPKLDVNKPADQDDLAFLGVAKLGHLLRTKQLTSVELTTLCLDRLKKFDPVLKCVVTLLPELAMKQAKQADEELAAGKIRGPLHGIPWGAKDLIAVPAAPTTWGAGHFQRSRSTSQRLSPRNCRTPERCWSPS